MEETTGEVKVTKSARNRSGGKKRHDCVRVSRKGKERGEREYRVRGTRRRGERGGWQRGMGNCAREREKAAEKKRARGLKPTRQKPRLRGAAISQIKRGSYLYPVEVADCSASGTHRRRRRRCRSSPAASTLQTFFRRSQRAAKRPALFCDAWLPATLKRSTLSQPCNTRCYVARHV